jgi:hypothetical protein
VHTLATGSNTRRAGQTTSTPYLTSARLS